MSQIDWNEVREFYLSCRSYKLTAERFGLSIVQVKSRAIRGNWKSATSEVPNLATCATPEVANPATCTTPEVANLATCATPEVANPATCTTPEVANLATCATPEVANPATCATPEVANPATCATPEVANLATCATPEVANLATCATPPGLPMLHNLAAHVVEVGTPWEAQVIPHEKLPSKASYRTYLTNPDTRDCVFSGIRGLNQSQRVGRENVPAALLAVVADYDMQLTDAERRKKTDKLVIKPNFISTSYSGGTHAVWLLQTPIPLMPNAEMVQDLLGIIARKLKLKNAYGPLDGKAYFNPTQYYHAGWDWKMVSPEPIAESLSVLWLDEALKKSKFTQSGVQIPLDRIREEMKKRGWDKRWQGAFELGARGVRFWDPLADCPTAAIVRENGMVCFTGAFPFQSWADIFGTDFIDAYRADTFGKALSECFFVNNNFYIRSSYKCENGMSVPGWQCLNRQNFELFANEHYNVSSKPEIIGEESPVKQLMAKIILLNSLPAATPFIYRKETIVRIQDEPRLNTSFLRVHEPDLSQGHSWGDGFPWIASFMERLFPDIIQRDRFMAAWAYAYRNAYEGRPRNGHVLFVAGGVGCGKNFLSECLYGESLGGSLDASAYILGQTRFNDYLMRIGVWTLNDTVAKGDSRERNIFAKALKKMAANQLHTCEGKYKSAAEIYWQGRIIVTLNTDPDSLQILPDIEVSNRDKISLFKTSDEPMQDRDGAAKARAEMGALCSYLLNWEIPEHCVGDARWGVRNYLHPELLAEASNSSSTASFQEILCLFVQSAFDADNRLDVLEGSATWFLQQMMLVDGVNDMLRGEVTARSIGKRMSALASTGDFPLEYGRNSKQRIWIIKRKAFMDYLNNPNQEGELDELCPF